MAEKPILFIGPLVRAILDGRKVQTRRPITKPRMTGGHLLDPDLWTPRRAGAWEAYHPDLCQMVEIGCPYGAPGDLLWVRETWTLAHPDYHSESEGLRLGDRPVHPNGRWCFYRATDGEIESGDHEDGRARWRPSIHMPRWAARLWLRVTGVRVERVQDISEADARAEGIRTAAEGATMMLGATPQEAFAALWSHAYGPESWTRNDWVWVVEFERAADPARGEDGR